jgi:hypothetical protein
VLESEQTSPKTLQKDQLIVENLVAEFPMGEDPQLPAETRKYVQYRQEVMKTLPLPLD